MQRINLIVLSFCFIIHLTAAVSANAGVRDMLWRYAASGINDTDLRTSATGSAGNVYAASGNVLYRTVDRGETWTEVLSFRSSGNVINAVAVSPDMTDTVYVCTSDGLYKSNDSGAKWQRVFSNIGEMEGNVLSIATGSKDSGVIYIGTGAGIFLTRDSGTGWEKGRGLPSDAAVRSIAIDSSGPDILYAALDRWIYKSVTGGKTWVRVYGSGPSAEDDIVPDEEETVEDDETASRADIRGLAAGQSAGTLYAGTAGGLLVSRDSGSTWKAAAGPGMVSKDIRGVAVTAADADSVYAATDRGVFRYSLATESWEDIYKGLVSADVRHLAASSSEAGEYFTLWAATAKGMFILVRQDSSDSSDEGAEKVFREFSHEPSIEEIRDAAIEYAEVQPDKIRKWRKAAAARAWLPDVRFEYQKSKDWQSSDYFYSTSAEKYKDDDITDGRDRAWSVCLTWELGDLVWNNDQTSIDSRSRLLVQLRDDVLNEVTRLYFERRRLQIGMLVSPPAGAEERIEKELRLRELTANIDALTGSYLSRRTGQKNF